AGLRASRRLPTRRSSDLEQQLFVCVNASSVEKDRAWMLAHRPADVVLEDRSRETALIALQGPASARVLERFAGAPLALPKRFGRSEEHTSALHSRENLVC